MCLDLRVDVYSGTITQYRPLQTLSRYPIGQSRQPVKAPASEAVDLNINSIKLDGEALEEADISTIGGQGGSDADVKASIGKATTAFLQLKNIWNSKQLSTNINITIFNTNVKTVLLYEDDSWRTTTTINKIKK
ncbi:unnamed protein product [Schistosoma curassoni]|uniref:DUF6451 domain-containing protein n=1 Tax=Schistosoma curassoni TaxID=6186 RepID=A0A183JNX6_9TREM|nr:unnamed protein product [Schistosoma curassoni]